MLICIMIGSVTKHIVNHNSLGDSIAAPIHRALALVVALASWPPHWTLSNARLTP
jgi:hypothetical protein